MLRQSSYRHRLWIVAGAVAIFLATVAGAELSRNRPKAPLHWPAQTPPAQEAGGIFALDFIAFYTGGRLVDEGRHRELFDLRAVKRVQNELAASNGAHLGDALGPWWNPPFYALLFVPLSRLPFGVATNVWVALNIACAAAACWMLTRMLPRDAGWRTKLLVPVLVALSVPFIHSVTHGQNACMSLLIVTAAVAAWRADRPMLAGLIAGLMAYKPQHAVVIGGMLALSAGWRAMLGLAITGAGLLLVTLLAMPGALTQFLTQMPQNVRFVQEQCVYLWERHVTLKAFWRLLIQGREIGPPAAVVGLLTALCTTFLVVGLLRMTNLFGRWLYPFDHTGQRERKSPEHRDRLIAATILATPLLMPFYFDYDLLILAVPAALLANLRLRTGRMFDGAALDRAVRVLFPIAYGWMLINADVAELIRVNVVVPLIGAIAALAVWPKRQQELVAAVQVEHSAPPRPARAMPLAKAA